MPKRASTDTRPGPQKANRSVRGQAREKPSEDEMGEFEDAWEDEIEDDGADADAAQGGDGTRVYSGAVWPHACMCSGH
jgi:ribosome assembly protein RRB1